MDEETVTILAKEAAEAFLGQPLPPVTSSDVNKIENAIADWLFKKPSCSECKGFRETRCYVDREHFKKTGELALSFEPCRTCVGRTK